MGGEYNEDPEGPVESPKTWLQARLATGPPLLLDGAMGTELERRGVATELPLWSTQVLLEEPQRVAEIHREYAAAGAEILTANTFRTQRRTLRRAKRTETAEELTRRAVGLAQKVASESARPILVAGSAPPLEDCYRPDLVPDNASLAREHSEHLRYLLEAGVDLVLIETMNSIREADAAARAAAESGVPFFASFVCEGNTRLLSGEPLRDAANLALGHGALCVLVNCVPTSGVSKCLAVLESAVAGSADRASETPYFGAYPNLGAPAGEQWSEPCSPRSEEHT
ncbi:MAG: homocysteine S-methyltransferase family protein, partial [Myxococcota bacterium]